MPYCVNCGSEVGTDAIICKDCGYDPSVKGKRIIPDRTRIESYAEVLAEAEKVSANADKVVCKSCFKAFERRLDSCPYCCEKNVEKVVLVPAHSSARKYATFTALALLAVIVALSIVHGL
jgi:hypothetical protein